MNIEALCEPHVYHIEFDLCGKGEPEPDQDVVYLHKITAPKNQFDTGYIIDG